MTDFSKKGTFNFWADHSVRFLEMALDSSRRGRLEGADGYGIKQGVCGDTVEFFLDIRGTNINSITYDLNGCLHTNACANTVASMAENRAVDEAWSITPEQIAEYLITLPQDHFHCAELAVGAFYLALSDYQRKTAPPAAG